MARTSLLKMLIGYDVDTVFGGPSDTNVSFYEALQRREDAITHVKARDGLYDQCLWAIYQSPGMAYCFESAATRY